MKSTVFTKKSNLPRDLVDEGVIETHGEWMEVLISGGKTYTENIQLLLSLKVMN